jgi:hypothetical protein
MLDPLPLPGPLVEVATDTLPPRGRDTEIVRAGILTAAVLASLELEEERVHEVGGAERRRAH